MRENRQTTEISQVGEFGLIEHLTSDIKPEHPTTLLGIGDDAAIIEAGEQSMVITTDMLIEGIHFDLSYTPLKHLGYKAVAVNLSDVYAMNANATQITVSIGISSRFAVEDIHDLYSGIKHACKVYKVDLVGGDTVASQSGLVISITALGRQSLKKIVKRSGAKENDLICVSGDLGSAYWGLKLLMREKEATRNAPELKPKFEGYEYLLERQLKPEPRKDIVRKLSEAGILPTAMIDISDGLSSEILHICKNSNKGCRIYDEKIPIHPQSTKLSNEFQIDPVVAALNGGEDYELLFTISPSDYEKVSQIRDISIIGHILPNPQQHEIVFRDGTTIPLMAQGWNAFRIDK